MNLVTFNKDKCTFLTPYRVGTGCLGSSSAERDLHILTDMSQHVSLHSDSEKWWQHTRLYEQERSQWVAGVEHSLDHHIGYTPSSFASPNTWETLIKLKLVQWRASKMRGLEHISRGWENCLCIAWTAESSGGILNSCLIRWYLRGYWEDRARPFTEVHGRRKRDSGHHLKELRFWFGTRKQKSPWSRQGIGTGSAGRVVKSTSFPVFKTRLAKALSKLVWIQCFEQEVGLDDVLWCLPVWIILWNITTFSW